MIYALVDGNQNNLRFIFQIIGFQIFKLLWLF